MLKEWNVKMDNKIFEIIKASIWKTPLEGLEDADWQSIYEELRSHAILALPGDIVNDTLVSDAELLKRWLNDIAVQIAQFHLILYYQTELTDLLRSKNLHPVILKGITAAMYYPSPEFRTMGDIDFYVPSYEYDACLEILCNSEYKVALEDDSDSYHTTLLKSGVHFELHKKPAGVEENERGNYLLDVINDGFTNFDIINIVSNEIPAFPALQNGIVLLLHIEKHLKEGLGLRQIIDWMMFVDRCIDDKIWEEEFKPVLKKGGLEKLAITVTKMCGIYLGLRTEKFAWCLEADDKLCESLMYYIMEQGNFGRKKRSSEYGAGVLSRTGTLLDFIKSLQKNGEMNWKLLNSHPHMRCFAWIYQIFHYLRSAFSRKKPLRALIADFQTAKKRKKMLKKLGVYQNKLQ